MTVKPIRCDADLHTAFKQLESVFQAPAGTEQADERNVLVTLIEAYEQKHYPIAYGLAHPAGELAGNRVTGQNNSI